MADLIIIVITAAFLNNVVLSQFLGICSFLGVSTKTNVAVGMGGAVVFVITIASAVANLLYSLVLDPLGLGYLDTIVFILVIAALVQLVEMFFKKYVPALYQALGIYLPLITTNCAVLGVALNNVSYGYNFAQSVLCGFGTAAGYMIAIIMLAGIRERFEGCNFLPSFKAQGFDGTEGAPVPMVCITAGLMAIAYMGFSGLNI